MKVFLDGVDPSSISADLLRGLCIEEVDEFDRYMRENEPNWKDGLAEWEKQAIRTYLYQKIRGRVSTPSSLPAENSKSF